MHRDDPGAAQDANTIEPIRGEGFNELLDPFVANVAPPAVGLDRHIRELHDDALTESSRGHRLMGEALQ